MFFTKTFQNVTSSIETLPFFVRKLNTSCISSNLAVLPTQAQVVICGSGAVANSVAYHLVEKGWTDVLLVDKGK